jgi:flagellar hook assembly protein FlgD
MDIWECGTYRFRFPKAPPPLFAARIRFTLASEGAARLVVRDSDGRQVKVLVDRVLAAGPHTAKWDGTNDEGSRMKAGSYRVELCCAGQLASTRIAWYDSEGRVLAGSDE